MKEVISHLIKKATRGVIGTDKKNGQYDII